MPRRPTVSELGFLRLDGRKSAPLVQQIYDSMRTAILEGRLKANLRIPSSRDLVEQLGVSRTTVVSAIDRLISEGYLQSVRGSGTFVCKEIPEECPFATPTSTGQAKAPKIAEAKRKQHGPVAKLAEDLASMGEFEFTAMPKPFCPGEPALDVFPVDVWSKIVRRVWKDVSVWDLSYGEPAGLYALREAVAEYLRLHRGANCTAEQVMIVSGTQQAVDVIGRLLIDTGDKVIFENPGYASARNALQKHGAQIVNIEVDEEGANVEEGLKKAPDARLVYITPSHQYPIGVTMPLERRLELLAWAAKSGGWILEDDYDSEYRYGQKPLPSLQGLDTNACTFYVGSFSKVVFPALGLGYVIVPNQLASAFENALTLAARPPSQIDQIVLTDFIREGHFGRHLRRMRKAHSERRELFVQEVESRLADRLTIIGSHAGLHCSALLKSKKSDAQVVSELDAVGVVCRPLSAYYAERTRASEMLKGLVFGFACANEAEITRGVSLISETI